MCPGKTLVCCCFPWRSLPRDPALSSQDTIRPHAPGLCPDPSCLGWGIINSVNLSYRVKLPRYTQGELATHAQHCTQHNSCLISSCYKCSLPRALTKLVWAWEWRLNWKGLLSFLLINSTVHVYLHTTRISHTYVSSSLFRTICSPTPASPPFFKPSIVPVKPLVCVCAAHPHRFFKNRLLCRFRRFFTFFSKKCTVIILYVNSHQELKLLKAFV